MKKILGIIIVASILIGCSENELKKNLIGNWRSTKSANIVELRFKKDTLISNSWGKINKFTWDCDKSNIYYSQLTNVDPELKKDFIFEYHFDLDKDTLYLRNFDSEFSNKFIRIDKK